MDDFIFIDSFFTEPSVIKIKTRAIVLISVKRSEYIVVNS